ncbi:hypothetical protein O988_07854 [Pseudogymnoascus sp. VKM F-3808]|nr:hypothetical protein O988_07854 [Pseudogymnoascus sp. VKM F-3808]
MIVQAVMIWATGASVNIRVQRGPWSLGDGRISGRFFIGRKMKGKAVDGFFVDCPDGMVEIYVNVPELCRRHKIIVEILECWRLLVVREAVFLVAETEVQQAEDGSFHILSGYFLKIESYENDARFKSSQYGSTSTPRTADNSPFARVAAVL